MRTWEKSLKLFGHNLGGFGSFGNLVVTLCLHSLDYMKSRHPILFEVIGNQVFMINALILFSCSIFGLLIVPFIFYHGAPPRHLYVKVLSSLEIETSFSPWRLPMVIPHGALPWCSPMMLSHGAPPWCSPWCSPMVLPMAHPWRSTRLFRGVTLRHLYFYVVHCHICLFYMVVRYGNLASHGGPLWNRSLHGVPPCYLLGR